MAERKTIDGSLALADKQVRVITIEATEKPCTSKLRVAAYARVSSSSADQLGSFAAQNDYYQNLIRSKENWTLADIYADMYNRILIQFSPHGSVEKWLKQRLSADLNRLPKAFFFVS